MAFTAERIDQIIDRPASAVYQMSRVVIQTYIIQCVSFIQHVQESQVKKPVAQRYRKIIAQGLAAGNKVYHIMCYADVWRV